MNARTLLTFGIATGFSIAGCDCGGNPDPVDGGLDVMVEVDMGGVDVGPPAPLDEGHLGTHLDMASLADGTLVLSGYSAGVPPSTRYGDLIIGTWDASSESVAWQIIDGVPAEPPTNAVDGWRGGISEPGDDVGQFTSIITDGSALRVSYWDVTNGALKFAAASEPGDPDGSPDGWAIHTVDANGWAGQYSDLIATPTGVAVAYLGVNPVAALPGRPTSEARVATASGVPGAPTDWTISNIGSAEIDCRPAFCPEGAVCLEDGRCAIESADCGECGETCVAGECLVALSSDHIEDRPPAIGLFPVLANTAGGLALVYYDRSLGNLMGAENDGAAWGAPFVIDGYSVGDPGIGDSGIGATLAVDAAGTWHVAYVDGSEETLRYTTVTGGAAETPVIVDNGSSDGTTPNPDGRHVIGDDASLVITDGGEVRIAYQDATSQRAMFARSGEGAEWTISVIDSDDSTGYFTTQVMLGTTSFVAEWWRRESREDRANGVRILTID